MAWGHLSAPYVQTDGTVTLSMWADTEPEKPVAPQGSTCFVKSSNQTYLRTTSGTWAPMGGQTSHVHAQVYAEEVHTHGSAYVTPAELLINAEPLGAIATHEAGPDPHPTYATLAETGAAYSLLGHTHAGGGASMLVIPYGAHTATWTNMPAGLTGWLTITNQALLVDAAAFTQVRLSGYVSTIGAAAAQVRLQYSTDASVFNYADGASGPAIALNTTGAKSSGWVNLVAGAKVDNVYLRVVGISGDGALDPQIRNLAVALK